MAIFILVCCFGYLGGVTFAPITIAGNEHAKTIVPYVLSIVGTIAGFYYGYSLGQKSKPPEYPKMDEAVKAGVEKLEVRQVEAVKTEGEK